MNPERAPKPVDQTEELRGQLTAGLADHQSGISQELLNAAQQITLRSEEEGEVFTVSDGKNSQEFARLLLIKIDPTTKERTEVYAFRPYKKIRGARFDDQPRVSFFHEKGDGMTTPAGGSDAPTIIRQKKNTYGLAEKSLE